jgi:hypothetical protein
MTQGTIIDSVTVTFNTILTDTPHVSIGILADLSIFGIVMTAPAIHWKDSAVFRLITMVTAFTLNVIFVRGGMS